MNDQPDHVTHLGKEMKLSQRMGAILMALRRTKKPAVSRLKLTYLQVTPGQTACVTGQALSPGAQGLHAAWQRVTIRPAVSCH